MRAIPPHHPLAGGRSTHEVKSMKWWTNLIKLAAETLEEAGKARDEGKEYVVKDGDIMLFKFNT